MESDVVLIAAKMPTPLAEALRAAAAGEDRTISSFVRQAIRKALAERENEGPSA